MAKKAPDNSITVSHETARSSGLIAAAARLAAPLRLDEIVETWSWLGYLAVIVLAELVVSLVSSQLGLAIHILLMVTLLIRATFALPRERTLLMALVFAPLIRIVSLSLPLSGVPTMFWYLLTSIPLFVAVVLSVRTLQLSRAEIGLRVTNVRLQILIGFLGYPLGAIEFLILHPTPMAVTATTADLLLPAAILLVCTGFLEELVFRGVLQAASIRVLGRWGLVYVSAVFAALHIGYLSAADVIFVFGVGLLFAWIVARTGSLLGVTIAHGLTNVLLLLVLPTFSSTPHLPWI